MIRHLYHRLARQILEVMQQKAGASTGATNWEICHLKIPHTFPMENMALKLTSQQIGG